MGEGRGSLSSLVVGESHEFRGLLRPSRTESNVEAKHRKCQNKCVLCGGPHSSGHIHPSGHGRFASSTRVASSEEEDCELLSRRAILRLLFSTRIKQHPTVLGPFNAEIKYSKGTTHYRLELFFFFFPSSSESPPLSVLCFSSAGW